MQQDVTGSQQHSDKTHADVDPYVDDWDSALVEATRDAARSTDDQSTIPVPSPPQQGGGSGGRDGRLRNGRAP